MLRSEKRSKLNSSVKSCEIYKPISKKCCESPYVPMKICLWEAWIAARLGGLGAWAPGPRRYKDRGNTTMPTHIEQKAFCRGARLGNGIRFLTLDHWFLVKYDEIWSGWWYTYPSEKYESQLGWLFPIYGKIKNVPNHQPEYDPFGCAKIEDPKHPKTMSKVKHLLPFGPAAPPGGAGWRKSTMR